MSAIGKLVLTAGFGVSFALAGSAQASTAAEDAYCVSFAELQRQMAIIADPTDPDGDAAYNYAADLCEGSSFAKASSEAREVGGCYVAQVAGGWAAVRECEDSSGPNPELDQLTDTYSVVPAGAPFMLDSDGSLVEVSAY